MRAQQLFIISILGFATLANAGRFESLTQRFAKGDKMTPVAATYFGGPGNEEFVDAGQLTDGTIVAFGNATGPEFPTAPKPVILGTGQHRALKALVPNKHNRMVIVPENPDLAGMIVFYDETLSKVLRVVRFDWGVASLTLGTVGVDGNSLFIAGRCTEALRTLSKSAASFKVEPYVAPVEPETPPTTDPAEKKKKKVKKAAPPSVGPYTYEGVTAPGDVFVARLNANGDKILWIWVFEGLRQPPGRLWTDKQGALYCDVRGLRRISADGQKAELINSRMSTGTAGWRAVDADGGLYFGGDRNTNTGYQPYRQPYLYKFNTKGDKLWTLWEPVPSECACGGNGNGLCSDSSVRGLSWTPNGDLLVNGWSDGGNSVFTRQPKNWREMAGKSALGMESWGMKNANSLSYLILLDAQTLQQKTYTLWLTYIPDTFATPRLRGAPNASTIETVCRLKDGSIGFCGGAGTGLIQTPHAFVTLPADGSKYGGAYVAVITGSMTDLLYSSYLPGCMNVAIAPCRRGLIVVSNSTGSDGAPAPTPSPVIKPLQGQCQGQLDAHILLLDLPKPPAPASK